jgi:plasmid stability protein
MSAKTSQYTIRNVPDEVDRELRRRARALKRSLNTVALEALAAAAGTPNASHRHSDLDAFFGSWVRDRRWSAR